MPSAVGMTEIFRKRIFRRSDALLFQSRGDYREIIAITTYANTSQREATNIARRFIAGINLKGMLSLVGAIEVLQDLGRRKRA